MENPNTTQQYMEKFLEEFRHYDIDLAHMTFSQRTQLAERLAVWMDKIIDAKIAAMIELQYYGVSPR